jgi:hypothetical protein
MIHDVRNTLGILHATHGGRVACEVAEELLLLAVVAIERTAGMACARGRLSALVKGLRSRRNLNKLFHCTRL